MSKVLSLVLSLFTVVIFTSCAGNSGEPSIGGNTPTSSSGSGQTSNPDSSGSENDDSTEPVSSDSTSSDAGKKVLVAYFSATGTTKALAEYAADAVSGDLYEIVPQEPYTSVEHILWYKARTTE